MTLQELSKYYDIQMTLEKDREALERLRQRITPASPQLTGMPHTPGVRDKVGDQQRRCCGYHLGGFQLAGLYLLRSVCGVHPDRPAHHAEQGDVLLHRLFDRVPDMDADVRHL